MLGGQAASSRLAYFEANATRCQDPAHELGHVLLHDAAEHRGAWDRNEVEAQTVANLNSGSAPTPTASYIARRSGGDLDLVRSSAERAITCPRRIIGASA